MVRRFSIWQVVSAVVLPWSCGCGSLPQRDCPNWDFCPADAEIRLALKGLLARIAGERSESLSTCFEETGWCANAVLTAVRDSWACDVCTVTGGDVQLEIRTPLSLLQTQTEMVRVTVSGENASFAVSSLVDVSIEPSFNGCGTCGKGAASIRF